MSWRGRVRIAKMLEEDEKRGLNLCPTSGFSSGVEPKAVPEPPKHKPDCPCRNCVGRRLFEEEPLLCDVSALTEKLPFRYVQTRGHK